MTLIEAIKETISKNGIAIISAKQFVNILDDVGAFKDEPAAAKKVLRGLLDSGFAHLIVQISESKEKNWQNDIRKCVNDYASKSGYKDDLINCLASKILFAVGIISELPKIETSPQAEKKPKSNIRIKGPKELLYALKQEYLLALSELITLGTDEFGHKYGYFTTDANTKLYVISSKILLVAKEVGESNIGTWLSTEKSKIEQRNRPNSQQVSQAIEDSLRNLEREYNALMEKSVIVEDDEFGLKSANFLPNSVSEFQDIEKKILLMGKRKKEDRSIWINKTKSDFLASKSSPVSARNGVLDQLKGEYTSRLATLDKSTKSGDIDFSDAELKDIRRKLINLGSLFNKNMEQWCDSTNDAVTQDRVKKRNMRRRNRIISIVGGFILVIIGWQQIEYHSSADERAVYEATMTEASSNFANGNYIEALTLFQKAEKEYTASYLSTSYKQDAHSKALEVSEKIVTDWKNQVAPLLQNNMPAQAKALTLSLPNNLVLEGSVGEQYNQLVQQIDTELNARANAMVDELLNDIYAHQGKLSESGKQDLEEMIGVVPDNYWLNFIKEKTK